jgi:hypothetical protein
MDDSGTCTLVIRYGHGDANAAMECLRTYDVSDIEDMLVRGPLASCVARPLGKTKAEMDQLIACLEVAGAIVVENLDEGAASEPPQKT